MPSPLRQLMFMFFLGTLCAFSAGSYGQSQAVILQYHHISTKMPAVTSISPVDFQAHMQYLKDHNFTVLALNTVLDALKSGEELPDRTAVLTFDDGYRSVYEQAFPELKGLGWPFTIFVTPGLVGSNASLYANWDQLREMADSGALLANHTMTHPYLLDRSPYRDEAAWLQGVRAEIETAEAQILNESGQSHKILAYPYGEFDPAIQALVTTLGYTAFAQNSGAIAPGSDFTALPRYPFSGNYASLGTFAIKVDSLAFNIRQIEPLSPVTTEQSPEAVLDFDGEYRLDALSCFHNDLPMDVVVEDALEQRYRLRSNTRSTGRRFHYNCTAPGRGGRYYWYSVLWVNPAIAE